MRKKLMILSIFMLMVYTALYFYKYHLYFDYETKYHARLGQEDNYVISSFYNVNGKFPNKEELVNYIEHTQIYRDTPKYLFLLKNNFFIKNDEKSDTIFIYENGPNYRNDDLKRRIKSEKEVNFFNYLIQTGDVVIFYSLKSVIIKSKRNQHNKYKMKPNYKIEKDSLENTTLILQ